MGNLGIVPVLIQLGGTRYMMIVCRYWNPGKGRGNRWPVMEPMWLWLMWRRRAGAGGGGGVAGRRWGGQHHDGFRSMLLGWKARCYGSQLGKCAGVVAYGRVECWEGFKKC